MIGSAHDDSRCTVSESSRPAVTSPSEALSLARDALAAEPAGLLTDFDGTISVVVTDPAMAKLVDGAGAALAALAERLAVVAVITGRSARDARRLTDVPGLLIAGNHGMEWLEPGAEEPSGASEARRLRGALDRILARVPALPGIVPEHKGVSASVHYRNAADPDVARDAIVESLGDLEPLGFRVGHGRMIVEVRPVGLGDKGSAVRDIVERFGLRGVVVMGDDVTDLDMFRAVGDLRAAGRVRAAIIGVGARAEEVVPEIAAASDTQLSDPAAAARFLAALADPSGTR
jgi:trehalose 6-phosphate phosphatase